MKQSDKERFRFELGTLAYAHSLELSGNFLQAIRQLTPHLELHEMKILLDQTHDCIGKHSAEYRYVKGEYTKLVNKRGE